MDVLFLSPAYPPEMQAFTRGLAEVGARVHGVGDTPPGALPPSLGRHLAGYLHVPAMGDEDDVYRRILAWLGGRRPDRIEANWEPMTVLAARLREALGLPGMSVDTVRGFRDKPLMRARVAAAGLRVPRSARVRTAGEAREAARAIGYPLVLKPVAGAGSADTWRVDDATALEAALRATAHVAESSLEEFIAGEELTYETLCIDGRPVYESVCRYEPSALVARKNAWISPIIQSFRSVEDPAVRAGVALGRQVLRALGMGTGFTHMEWFRLPNGEAVFGEIACRPPGANMVDLMNYTGDVDLYRAWADAVVHGRVGPIGDRPYSAAIVFKRARGRGRIRAIHGLEAFLRAHGGSVARVDLLPIGAPRRDWTQTFLSDGNLVVRDPDPTRTIALARAVATTVHLDAG
jgi:biotin carboxylase